jgi:hypothetical protein
MLNKIVLTQRKVCSFIVLYTVNPIVHCYFSVPRKRKAACRQWFDICKPSVNEDKIQNSWKMLHSNYNPLCIHMMCLMSASGTYKCINDLWKFLHIINIINGTTLVLHTWLNRFHHAPYTSAPGTLNVLYLWPDSVSRNHSFIHQTFTNVWEIMTAAFFYGHLMVTHSESKEPWMKWLYFILSFILVSLTSLYWDKSHKNNDSPALDVWDFNHVLLTKRMKPVCLILKNKNLADCYSDMLY